MVDAIYIINFSVVAFDCINIHITTSFDLFFHLSAPLQMYLSYIVHNGIITIMIASINCIPSSRHVDTITSKKILLI